MHASVRTIGLFLRPVHRVAGEPVQHAAPVGHELRLGRHEIAVGLGAQPLYNVTVGVGADARAEAVASEGRAVESEVSNETDESDEALSRAGTRELSPVLGLPAETSAAC